MIRKINFLEIRRDSISILKTDSNVWAFYSIYYIFPLVSASITIFYFTVQVDKELFRNLIAGISLFSGLLFSIIFIVSENYKDRRINLTTQDEENINYLNRYHKFSSDLISLISYTIIKALIIIILTVIISLYNSNLNSNPDFLLKLQWVFLLFYLYHFLIYVIIILNEIYSMQYEEINRKIKANKPRN